MVKATGGAQHPTIDRDSIQVCFSNLCRLKYCKAVYLSRLLMAAALLEDHPQGGSGSC